MKVSTVVAAAFLVSAGMTAPVYAQDKEKEKAAKKGGGGEMTFFVTSVGKGNGADLGGLEGADAHCNALAKAAGSKRTNWKAYLSTTAPGGDAGVNARDRIGKGPWRNAKGVVVASNVARPAFGQEQRQQADRPDREGRDGQRPRRYAERARHPHRLGPGRPVLDRGRRHDLRQLVEERRRLGDRRPP